MSVHVEKNLHKLASVTDQHKLSFCRHYADLTKILLELVQETYHSRITELKLIIKPLQNYVNKINAQLKRRFPTLLSWLVQNIAMFCSTLTHVDGGNSDCSAAKPVCCSCGRPVYNSLSCQRSAIHNIARHWQVGKIFAGLAFNTGHLKLNTLQPAAGTCTAPTPTDVTSIDQLPARKQAPLGWLMCSAGGDHVCWAGQADFAGLSGERERHGESHMRTEPGDSGGSSQRTHITVVSSVQFIFIKYA